MEISSLLNPQDDPPAQEEDERFTTSPESSRALSPQSLLPDRGYDHTSSVARRSERAPESSSLMWVESDVDSIAKKRSTPNAKVKQHVMRTYARQKKKEDIERLRKTHRSTSSNPNVSPQPPAAVPHQSVRDGGFHDEIQCNQQSGGVDTIEIVQRRTPTLNSRSPFHPSRVDPFQTACFPLSIRMNELIHYYATVMVPLGHLMLPIRDWEVEGESHRYLQQIPLILGSASLLHAVLSLASIIKDGADGRPPDHALLYQDWKKGRIEDSEIPEFLLHKGQSNALINKAFKDPEQKLSDEVFRTLDTLCKIELILRDENDIQTHYDGLERLVYMRGGSLSGLSFDLGLADVGYAGLRFAKPLLPPLLFSESEEALWFDSIRTIMTYTTPSDRKLDDELLQIIHSSGILVFRDLRILTLLRDVRHHHDVFNAPGHSYLCIKRTYAIDHDILRFPYEIPPLTPLSSPTTPKITYAEHEPLNARATRLAALIFNESTVFPGEPFKRARMPFYHTHIFQTLNSLEADPPANDAFWAETPNLAFWIAVMACFSSRDRPEHDWFVEYLRQGAERLRVRELEVARGILKRFWYLEWVHDPGLEAVWAAVKGLMGRGSPMALD